MQGTILLNYKFLSLSVYLSILSVYLSVYLSIYPIFIYLYLSVYPIFIYLSIYLSILSVCLFICLSVCRVSEEECDEDFLPSPMSRYRQLLFASLKFCLAILTSLGIENQDCGNQVSRLGCQTTWHEKKKFKSYLHFKYLALFFIKMFEKLHFNRDVNT